jgi:hypothetical protein
MKRTLVLALMVLLAVSGCGGSKNKTAATKTSTPSASVPSSFPSGVVNVECLRAATAFSEASKAFSAGPKADLGQQMGALAQQLRALKDAVPSGAVRDATATLADAYASFAEKVKGITWNPSAGQMPPAGYMEALQTFSNPKFSAAAQTLGTYFSSGCRG